MPWSGMSWFFPWSPILQDFLKIFRYHSKRTSCNGYHHHSCVPQLCSPPGKSKHLSTFSLSVISHNNNQQKSHNNNQQKKRICKIVDFAVPANHRMKESEKKDRYLDLARELKKLWNMKVTIVPIVIGALGTIIKGLLKGLEDLEVGGRVETIQTTALLRTARILTRFLETWGDLLSLKLQWKTIR